MVRNTPLGLILLLVGLFIHMCVRYLQVYGKHGEKDDKYEGEYKERHTDDKYEKKKYEDKHGGNYHDGMNEYKDKHNDKYDNDGVKHGMHEYEDKRSYEYKKQYDYEPDYNDGGYEYYKTTGMMGYFPPPILLLCSMVFHHQSLSSQNSSMTLTATFHISPNLFLCHLPCCSYKTSTTRTDMSTSMTEHLDMISPISHMLMVHTSTDQTHTTPGAIR